MYAVAYAFAARAANAGSVDWTVKSAIWVVPTRETETAGAATPRLLLTISCTGVLCTSSSSVASCCVLSAVEEPELALTPWARKYRVAVLWYCFVRDLSKPTVAATATSTTRMISSFLRHRTRTESKKFGVAGGPVPVPGTAILYCLRLVRSFQPSWRARGLGNAPAAYGRPPESRNGSLPSPNLLPIAAVGWAVVTGALIGVGGNLGLRGALLGVGSPARRCDRGQIDARHPGWTCRMAGGTGPRPSPGFQRDRGERLA